MFINGKLVPLRVIALAIAAGITVPIVGGALILFGYLYWEYLHP